MTEWELVTVIKGALTPEICGELARSANISRSTVRKFQKNVLPSIRLNHYLEIVQATRYSLFVDDHAVATSADFGRVLKALLLKGSTSVRGWVFETKFKYSHTAISRWCLGARSPLLANARQIVELLGSQLRLEKLNIPARPPH